MSNLHTVFDPSAKVQMALPLDFVKRLIAAFRTLLDALSDPNIIAGLAADLL